jgi:hypothetical protein
MYVSGFFHSARKMQFRWKIAVAAARDGRLEFPTWTRFYVGGPSGGAYNAPC